MKPFRDWHVYSQLFTMGFVPVMFSVTLISAFFFGGLSELKRDAVSTQYILHDMRADSYFFTSSLRRFLIFISENKPSQNIEDEIRTVRERMDKHLEEYSAISEEGEAVTEKSKTQMTALLKELELLHQRIINAGAMGVTDPVRRLDQDISDTEEHVHNIFNELFSLVEDEINFEIRVLSWFVAGTSILSIALSLLFVRKVTVKVESQILNLKNASRDLGEGRLDVRAGIDSKNEIGELGDAFNRMADALQHTLLSLEKEISLRKHSEEELRKSHDDLGIRIRERTDELQSTFQQLAHAGRLTALGEMATGVAHEIRQPLAIIDLAGTALSRFVDGKNTNSDLARASLAKIREQVERADRIIDNMRAFARINTSELKPIDLQAPVETAISFFKEQCRGSSIDLEVVKTFPLPRVCADGQKIEQLVVNLISNAKYAVETKKLADKSRSRMHIDVRLRYDAKNASVILEVSDNGTGMDPDEADKCMNPFFTTKPVGQGTGLGLSIVYNIVQEIRGRVEVESKKGGGSTFRVILPAGEENDVC